MAVGVTETTEGIHVRLTGLDRLFCWRRGVDVDRAQIASQRVETRADVEATIGHRAFGWGTHYGHRRLGRRRVGGMLGGGAAGTQFWAVAAGPVDEELAILDLTDHEFARLVVPAAELVCS